MGIYFGCMAIMEDPLTVVDFFISILPTLLFHIFSYAIDTVRLPSENTEFSGILVASIK